MHILKSLISNKKYLWERWCDRLQVCVGVYVDSVRIHVEVWRRPRFALTSRLWTAALVRSKKALQFLRTGDKQTAPLANNEAANKRCTHYAYIYNLHNQNIIYVRLRYHLIKKLEAPKLQITW